MSWKLPDAVQYALNKLNSNGYEAYVVGGCVRDYLMNKTPQDWDITTSATPQQMQEVFIVDRTIETGLKHGTLTVLVDGLPLEITTYRIDGAYSDGRHPDAVSFTTSLIEDLKRRDFTINAMAFHPVVGVVDPFDGREDLKHTTIRCVGNPVTRFSEDALRILRALRFSSVLGFSIDTDTAVALRRLSPTLQCVSTERITNEFIKLVCGKYATEVLQTYHDVISEFFPEIACDNTFCLTQIRPLAHARFATLLYFAGITMQDAETALRRLRLDTKTIRNTMQLLSVNTPITSVNRPQILRLLNLLGSELIFDYFSMHGTDSSVIRYTQDLLANGACYSISLLDIDGDDVIASGIASGPAVGDMLHRLLCAVMDGDCPNEREHLVKYIEKLKKPVQ